MCGEWFLEYFCSCKVEVGFLGCVFIGVGIVYSVFINIFGKQCMDGVRCCFSWVSSVDQCMEVFYCVVFFQYSCYDWAGRYEINKFVVERVFFMYFVKFVGFFGGKFGQFYCYNVKFSFVDFGEDGVDVFGFDGVGFDYGEGFVISYIVFRFFVVLKICCKSK